MGLPCWSKCLSLCTSTGGAIGLIPGRGTRSHMPLGMPTPIKESREWMDVAVQSLSCVRLFVTPWAAAHQASLSFTISWSLLKLVSIELVIPSKHPILCCPLLLLPLIFPCIRVFSSEFAFRIRWPKYWSLSISPSSEYSGLIYFRIYWFIFLLFKGLLRVFCTTIRNHQFFRIKPSAFFLV